MRRKRDRPASRSGATARRPRTAIQLTDRDRAILADLVRLYALTADQVARRHFGSVHTAYHRLGALAGAGYLALHRPWYRGPGVYLATPAGARLAAVGLPAPRYRPMALAHHLAVADVGARLTRAYAGSRWVCERELRRAAMAAVRDRRGGRLVDGVPHVPDGVLVLPSAPSAPSPSAAGAANGARVAVEVELTRKGDAEYARILRWYGAELGYQRVVWLCAGEPVRRRLAELIRREQVDDFMTVEPLPAAIAVASWG
jgi:hypothetical protein